MFNWQLRCYIPRWEGGAQVISSYIITIHLKNYSSHRSGNWLRDDDFPFVMPQFGTLFTRSKIPSNYTDQVKLSLATHLFTPKETMIIRQQWDSDYHSSSAVGFINHNCLVSRGEILTIGICPSGIPLSPVKWRKYLQWQSLPPSTPACGE